jgi:ABC-type sugar transport system substrate-binding protein
VFPIAVTLCLLGCKGEIAAPAPSAPTAPPPLPQVQDAAPTPPPPAATPKVASSKETVKGPKVKKDKYVFGVSLPSSGDEFGKNALEGHKQVAGANDVELKIVSADGSVDKQTQQIGELAAAKVDALLVVPADAKIGAAVAAAVKGQVPVVACGGELSGGEPTLWVAKGLAPASLSAAQAKELGRVAVESGFDYLHGDAVPKVKGLEGAGG